MNWKLLLACLVVVLCAPVPTFAQSAGGDPNCQDDYPRYVRLFVGEKQQWESDRLAFTKLPRAEIFVAKGRYAGKVLYPVAALFDEHPEAHFIRFDACGTRYEDLSLERVRAEPWRYYLWNRKVQNGYLKFMDFGDTLKDSPLEPLADAEKKKNGPGGRRLVRGGVSGNPEVLRFIHTITLSKEPLPKPAVTPDQTEPAGGAVPGAKPGRGKGKK